MVTKYEVNGDYLDVHSDKPHTSSFSVKLKDVIGYSSSYHDCEPDNFTFTPFKRNRDMTRYSLHISRRCIESVYNEDKEKGYHRNENMFKNVTSQLYHTDIPVIISIRTKIQTHALEYYIDVEYKESIHFDSVNEFNNDLNSTITRIKNTHHVEFMSKIRQQDKIKTLK